MVRGTIKITLESGVRIPTWIKYQTRYVKIRRKFVTGRRVKQLTIRGAEAQFCSGGALNIKMPSANEYRRAFAENRVLEVEEKRGGTVKLIQNWHLCTECYKLSCDLKNMRPGTVAGKHDYTSVCRECRHMRVLENI